jgi:hypothetical protein
MKFFLVCFFTITFFQTKDPTIITWNENAKLKWSDFRDFSNKKYKYGATSAVYLYYNPQLLSNDSINITIKANFDRSQSWYIRALARNELLSHEQLHFDIVELFARKFRKRLLDFNDSLDFASLQKRCEVEFMELQNQCNMMQNQNDVETSHGVDPEAQDEWDKNVLLELIKMKGYKSESVKLKLKKAN